ncbi:FixH family protein [Nocardia huaxiensis]|uniref:FixH family protein n=1 Tax=Nocardia huaxiensis TaxID=2755382 RepID=A0A7D6VEC5_9NOCA|nr:FixH family protein [Nocardia huaxiensis]QLY30515.1 FixH family protein [Nocardia huaxiensis]
MTLRRGVLAVALAVIAVIVAWWLWPSAATQSPRMTAGPYLVRLTVNDGSHTSGGAHTGDNAVDLEITDHAGNPVAPDQVAVEPAMPQMGHAVPPAAAEPITPGRYRATVNLPMPGQWEIAVDLSGPEGSGRATFAVQAKAD